MMTEERSQPDPENEVDELMRGLHKSPDEISFDEPWEIRAFALAVAAHKSGEYPWADFQQALINSIKTWEDSVVDVSDPSWSYYEHWLNAFEVVLSRRRVVNATAVDARMQEVLETPANRNHHEPHYEPVAIDPAIRS